MKNIIYILIGGLVLISILSVFTRAESIKYLRPEKGKNFNNAFLFDVNEDENLIVAENNENDGYKLSYFDRNIKKVWQKSIKKGKASNILISSANNDVLIQELSKDENPFSQKIYLYNRTGTLLWDKKISGDVCLNRKYPIILISQRMEGGTKDKSILLDKNGKIQINLPIGYGDGFYLSDSGKYIVIDKSIYLISGNKLIYKNQLNGRLFINDISSDDKCFILSNDDFIVLYKINGQKIYELKVASVLNTKHILRTDAAFIKNSKSIIAKTYVGGGVCYLYSLDQTGMLNWKLKYEGTNKWKSPITRFGLAHDGRYIFLALKDKGIVCLDNLGGELFRIPQQYGNKFLVTENGKNIFTSTGKALYKFINIEFKEKK
jgi:hypothetical protein